MTYRGNEFLGQNGGLANQPGRPTDADKHPIRSAYYPNIVETPFAVARDAAGTDNEVFHSRGDGINFGRANENAKWIVLLGRRAKGRLPPGSGAPRRSPIHSR